MDYRQIELFVAVAERLNISQAADAMRMTQPGLSKSLNQLQRELGVSLYHRRGRGIELTEAGVALLRHGKAMAQQLVSARVELDDIASGNVSHIRIGAGPSWLSRHLPDSIAEMLAEYPRVRFSIVSDFPDRLIGQLRRGDIDVVVGALPENRLDPDLRFTRLTTDTVMVIGRANHPLLTNRKRSLRDYAGCRWILPGPHEPLRTRFARIFVQRGMSEPEPVLESDSLSMTFATLRITDLLSILAAQTLSLREADGIVAVDLEELRFAREAGITVRREYTASPALTVLIGKLKRIAVRHVEN